MFLAQLMLTNFAIAQDGVFTNAATPELNAQHFRPTIDGKRTLWSDDASRGAHNTGMARLLFHYTSNPLVYIPDGADEEIGLLTTVVQADVLAGYTYDRFRLGVDLPVFLFANGDNADGTAGLGDVAPDLKVTLLDGEDAPLNIAINGRLVLPTSTMNDLALKNGAMGYEISAIVDKPIGDFLLAANVGTRGGPNVTLEELQHNDWLIYRTALGYAFSENAGTAIELAGRMDYTDPTARGSSPIEWLLGGYGYASDDIVVRGGVGTGLTAGLGSPDLRLMLGVGFEPRAESGPKDSDMDGIVDKEDQCPEEPEDKDSFEDTDGCPDLDNDADGIVDTKDKCPMDPEDKDGYQDNDGCADPNAPVTVLVVDENGQPIDLARMTLNGGKISKKGRSEINMDLPPGSYKVQATAGTYDPQDLTFDVVNGPEKVVKVVLKKQKEVKIVVTRDRIDLKDKVYFATGKSTIMSKSHELLGQAIQILRDYPEIRKLRIEGHTDSRGSASYNLKLSKARAASVRQHFIEQGIDPNRLLSEGYGEERPLDPANNEAAWSKNRRVDFFIESWVDQD